MFAHTGLHYISPIMSTFQLKIWLLCIYPVLHLPTMPLSVFLAGDGEAAASESRTGAPQADSTAEG